MNEFWIEELEPGYDLKFSKGLKSKRGSIFLAFGNI